MITLKNGNAVLKINELGAEMKSFVVNGVEYLWLGDPEIWDKSAPNLFPMAGAMKDDKYIFDGKEYNMPKHGFAKAMMFEVESVTEDTATFLLTANEQTKTCYPFDFEFRVCYKLNSDNVVVDYKVTNPSDETIWFSVGSHDAFATPEGFDKYDIIFPEEETLDNYLLYGSIIGDETNNIIKNSKKLVLSNDLFDVDSLVFKNIKSRYCHLVNRKTGRGVRLDYADATYMVIWALIDGPYICIEPWYGVPDHINSNYDITKKEGIEKLNAGETFSRTRVITAIEG